MLVQLYSRRWYLVECFWPDLAPRRVSTAADRTSRWSVQRSCGGPGQRVAYARLDRNPWRRRDLLLCSRRAPRRSVQKICRAHRASVRARCRSVVVRAPLTDGLQWLAVARAQCARVLSAHGSRVRGKTRRGGSSRPSRKLNIVMASALGPCAHQAPYMRKAPSFAYTRARFRLNHLRADEQAFRDAFVRQPARGELRNALLTGVRSSGDLANVRALELGTSFVQPRAMCRYARMCAEPCVRVFAGLPALFASSLNPPQAQQRAGDLEGHVEARWCCCTARCKWSTAPGRVASGPSAEDLGNARRPRWP